MYPTVPFIVPSSIQLVERDIRCTSAVLLAIDSLWSFCTVVTHSALFFSSRSSNAHCKLWWLQQFTLHYSTLYCFFQRPSTTHPWTLSSILVSATRYSSCICHHSVCVIPPMTHPSPLSSLRRQPHVILLPSRKYWVSAYQHASAIHTPVVVGHILFNSVHRCSSMT